MRIQVVRAFFYNGERCEADANIDVPAPLAMELIGVGKAVAAPEPESVAAPEPESVAAPKAKAKPEPKDKE